MTRPRAALAASAALAALAAWPAAAQEGGPVRTGEHADFTRVVMTIDPTTEWSLETAPGRATILFPGRRLAFGLDGVWDRIPRDRVTAIETTTGPEGTRIVVGVGCDCRISASFVGARHLALDVGDRGAPRAAAVPPEQGPAENPAEDPAARALREERAVASAEAALIAQIARAADQGVVTFTAEAPSEAAATPEASPAPAPRPRPTDTAEPPLAEPTHSEPADVIAALASLDQIEATTVYDRDGAALAASRPKPPLPPVCLPDEALDLAAWITDAPFTAQTPVLMRRLVGEFDRPEPEAVRDLARLYVRVGFGAEAASLFAAFPEETPDRALLLDLARAVEAGHAAPEGPLAVAEACPGRHGLWLAVGGAAPAFHDADHFAGVQAAFADLPVDLRVLVGPRLALRLLEAGRPAEARLIHTTVLRAGGEPNPELALVAARLDAADGEPNAAVAGLRALAESGDPVATDALTALARLALDHDLALPERLLTDLRAAALVHRGDPREAELRALLVESLAAQGALDAALAEAAAARADLPADRRRFGALAVDAVATADPARVGPAAYAEAALAVAPYLLRGPGGDAPRRAIAGQLVDLGLPNAALTLLGPAILRGEPDARRLAARAELAEGRPEAALAALRGLAGPVTASLSAKALARSGAPADAVAALEAAGDPAAAAPYAWASGDWTRAAAATDDPGRAAMAAFMASRADGAPATDPLPAADPATLTQEAAFAAPLPQLERPSLVAARTLVANGRQVGGFVGALLAPPPPPAE